jgi:hypothetical protein
MVSRYQLYGECDLDPLLVRSPSPFLWIIHNPLKEKEVADLVNMISHHEP